MKKLIFIAIIVGFGTSLASCQSKKESGCSSECSQVPKSTGEKQKESGCSSECGQGSKSAGEKSVSPSDNTVGVYYFHGDRRCKTCKAVGATAREVANELKVRFFDINVDREENKATAKEFQASGSGLFVKHDNPSKIEDLTSFAFRNAINDSIAYVKKLKSTIKPELDR